MSAPGRAKRILDICDQAIMLNPDAREAFLASVCGDDHDLRDSVDSLLQAIEDSGRFLTFKQGAVDGD